MHVLPQDDIYRPNYYLSLMEFRQLTLDRLQKFVDQKFFTTRDYLDSKCMDEGFGPQFLTCQDDTVIGVCALSQLHLKATVLGKLGMLRLQAA